jgi:predicted membrane-bound spermidine synthase
MATTPITNIQPATLTPSQGTYAGLFFVTLATLMFEILLTRIISVMMGYQLAFAAISLAMFGMTLGALHVYRNEHSYSGTNAKAQMTRAALWFALTVIVCLLIQFIVPFPSRPALASLWIFLGYPLLSVPFYYSGVCVCVALTKFPARTSGLYAVDLAGAACGCILVIYVLEVTDAPTALVIVALLASVAATLFATDGGQMSLKRIAMILSGVLLIFVTANTILTRQQASLLRVTWAKGHEEPRPLYEKWNSFSRIAVSGDPHVATNVITEGISSTCPPDRMVRQLHLRIDADAETTLTALDGRIDDLDYLKYDVKSVVYYLRPNANAMVIGAGGGRDVLSALLFGARSVRAVEINRDILRTVNERFGDFTGHLNWNPRVTFVNDEARSYIKRTDDRFDVIEASFIDTWAATAAGALSCTENSIYTIEAWNLFLNRLTPSGVLSFSRWYQTHQPAEAYRLTSLGAAALQSAGVVDSRAHILLVRNLRKDEAFRGALGAVTILVSKAPFSSAELDEIEMVSRRLQFDIVLSPRYVIDPIFAELAKGNSDTEVSANTHLNVSPPTDNIPFFFYMTLPRESLKPKSLGEPGGIVGVLLLLVVFLIVFFIFLPVLGTLPRATVLRATPDLLFFAAIGLGYMLIEISQMQRFMLFLGHPTYTLAVVLFVLLLSSGAGSYATRGIKPACRRAFACLIMLLVVVCALGLLMPLLLSGFASATASVRVVVAAGMLIPIGFFMGMAFPLGMKLSGQRLQPLTPGLWGINGAASVFGSILSLMIAMNLGISNSFWAGFASYGIALCAYVLATQTSISPERREVRYR